MTTHPAVIVAAAEVFAGWGATVVGRRGAGPHPRHAVRPRRIRRARGARTTAGFAFADLNYEEVAWRRNRGRFSPLAGIYLPAHRRRGRLRRLDAQAEDPPLGRRHRQHEELLRRAARHQVRLAEERAAPQRHSRDGGRHQLHAAAHARPSSTPSTAWKATARSSAAASRWAWCSSAPTCRRSTPRPPASWAWSRRAFPISQLAEGRLGPLDERLIEQRGEPWQSRRQPVRAARPGASATAAHRRRGRRCEPELEPEGLARTVTSARRAAAAQRPARTAPCPSAGSEPGSGVMFTSKSPLVMIAVLLNRPPSLTATSALLMTTSTFVAT